MKNYTLITGASSGIGRSVALYLSKSRNLILCARNIEELERTKEKCDNGSDILIWNCDLSKCSEIEYSFCSFANENNDIQIDGLVHCAGILKLLPLRNVTYEDIMETFNVNVFSAELLVKILSSRKYNGKNLKSVVFISSNISNRGTKAFSVYGSSKTALDGIMRNLSMELAPGVRINSILPGGMKTSMTENIYDETCGESRYPLGEGKPNDIAPMVEFLLGDNSRWITGQQIVIDGGISVNLCDK